MVNLTGISGRRMLTPLLVLAFLGASLVAGPVSASSALTGGEMGYSAVSSNGEDVSFLEVYLQGFKDGFSDGARFIFGYRPGKITTASLQLKPDVDIYRLV